MRIKTKWEIGNMVWAMESNKPKESCIYGITIDVKERKKPPIIWYQIFGTTLVREENIYPDKKSLINSFMEE